jgi:hypothetical protein
MKPRAVWLPSYDLVVGTKPDSELSKEIAIPVARIAKRRIKLGILPYVAPKQPKTRRVRTRPPKKKARSIVAPYTHLLGAIPDVEVAALAKCTRQAVGAYRKQLGIAPHTETFAGELLAALGTAPDAEIARRFSVNNNAVGRLRLAHGIQAFKQPAPRRSLPAALDMARCLERNATDELPGFTIADLATALNRKYNTFMALFYKWHADGCFDRIGYFPKPAESRVKGGKFTEIRWTVSNADLPPVRASIDISVLGTMSDHNAARLMRVSVSRVWHQRTMLKIPAYKPRRTRTAE